MTGDKILIVDDEATNVEIFDLMLSKLGFSTDIASDGVEALEKLRSFRPALILLDNMMPRMTGWEVTRKIKHGDELAEYRDVSIIMFSAADDVEDKVQGLELGVDDYITKPFNFTEVLARMRAGLIVAIAGAGDRRSIDRRDESLKVTDILLPTCSEAPRAAVAACRSSGGRIRGDARRPDQG